MNSPNPSSAVVITGAAVHIGLACARRFPGRPLLLCDLHAGPLQAVAESLASHGAEVSIHACDLTHADQAWGLAAAASDLGEIGVLVHAAGVAPPTAPEVIYAVNLFGTRHLLAAFQPVLGAGDVAICIASLAGHRRLTRGFDALLMAAVSPQAVAQEIAAQAPAVNPTRLAYAASKRATILLAQQAAVEWGAQGARALIVSPGWWAIPPWARRAVRPRRTQPTPPCRATAPPPTSPTLWPSPRPPAPAT